LFLHRSRPNAAAHQSNTFDWECQTHLRDRQAKKALKQAICFERRAKCLHNFRSSCKTCADEWFLSEPYEFPKNPNSDQKLDTNPNETKKHFRTEKKSKKNSKKQTMTTDS
jgi:hypothetical protein